MKVATLHHLEDEKVEEEKSNAVIGLKLPRFKTNSRKRRLMITFSKWFLCSMCFLTAFYYMVIYSYYGIWTAQNWLNQKKEHYRLALVEYLDGKQQPTEEIQSADAGVRSTKLTNAVNKAAAKYRVNPIILWAVIEQETSFGHNRLRFEQSWKDQYSKTIPKDGWMNDIEYNMYFTSIGYMQVSYGLWRKTCDIRYWDELIDTDRNIDCGAKILSDCINKTDRNSVENNAGILRSCFRQYNGSGKQAEVYADNIMRKLQNYMIVDMESFSKQKMEERDRKMEVSLSKNHLTHYE